ncbi:PAN domain-containing protein [Microdochium nivale]|nr:PAN domain-containing protein [Microdochium nivale]
MSRHAAIAAAALTVFGGLVSADVYPVSLPPVAHYPAQTVTTADQVVYLPGCEKETRTHSYSDRIVTTTVPAEGCPTGYAHVEGCGSGLTPGGPLVIIYRHAVEWVEVYEKTVSCPYSELGPYGYPEYEGSEYCTDGYECQTKQTGYVKECYNGNCAAYKCYWGADGVQHCDDHSTPSGYYPAPAGCEVVTAHYPQCFDGHCFLSEAYYTVPVVIGFPIVYPPGFCQHCLLPPGWGVITTQIPGYSTSTTMTIPTTTVTSTTTTTFTEGGVTPTAGPLNCPEADRTVFVADDGTTFLIECNVGVSGTEINARAEEISRIAARALGTTGTFNGCIELCADIQECEAVSYNPDTGVCRGFTDASTNTSPNGDYVATVIRRAPQASSTTSVSSTTSTSSTAPGPSDDMDAAEVKREELVPKSHAKKHVRGQGHVERRAGRIVSPNAQLEKKDNIRFICCNVSSQLEMAFFPIL